MFFPVFSLMKKLKHPTSSLHSSSSLSPPPWDPTVHLTLPHPALHVLEKCTPSTPATHLKVILAHMLRLGLTSHSFPTSRLLLHLSSSSSPPNVAAALRLFRHFVPCPNLFMFNTIISALSTTSPRHSLALYTSMLASPVPPNDRTLLALLKCVERCLLLGKQVHAHAIVLGLAGSLYLINSILRTYGGCGRSDLARNVFETMPGRDVVSYNVMIFGYGRNGRFADAFGTFRAMRVRRVEPDEYTMVGLLWSCGRIRNARLGKSLHAWTMRRMAGWGLVLNNALLDTYTKCGEMRCAVEVFKGLRVRDGISWNVIVSGFANVGEVELAWKYFCKSPARDSVSWNSMLAGFARKGEFARVMDLFEEMVAQHVRPDKVTAIALVSAAAEMRDSNRGRCVHGWVVKNYGNLDDAFLGSALIDMYCKCGSIGRALLIFKTVSEKDVALWTAMISGLAFHGRADEALDLFWGMQEVGLVPNSVTLVAVLTACSHAGLTDQGCRIFEDMREKYGIEPGVEHYGCLVDLFARSGRLSEAEDVVQRMPMKPSRSIWGAILSGSKTHGDWELAETASRKLQKLEPEEEGGYVLLSNVYASCGRWSYCDEVREVMEERGIKKMAGHSSLVVDGAIH